MQFKTVLQLFVLAIALSGSGARGDQIDEANAEVTRIAKTIKYSGPSELRALPLSQIENTARSFVYGSLTGSSSSAQLARLGGVQRATENALLGQLRAYGTRP